MKPAIRFNKSTTSYASVPPPPTCVTAFGMWIYLHTDNNAWGSFYNLDGTAGGDEVAVRDDGTTFLYAPSGVTAPDMIGLDVGRWYYACGNRFTTSGQCFLFSHAGLVASYEFTGANNFTHSAVTLGVWDIGGGNGGPADTLDGCVAHVRIWHARSLSRKQFRAEMRSPRAVSRAGLWAELPFAGAGDLKDRSRRGNHVALGAGTITSQMGPPGVLGLPKRRAKGAVVSAPPPPTGQFWLAAAA